jgi:putative tryptophan/tyrosine transport system substrate-binding protein
MRRRELVALLAGTLASWPLAARAQQGGRVRRVGVLVAAPAGDSEYPTLFKAFVQGLQDLGWIDGRNLKVDVRWTGAGAEAVHKDAAELVALAPDVILAAGSASTGPLLQVTKTIPVVFTVVPDPVAAGFVESLARPGGNATGFASFELLFPIFHRGAC